VILIPPIIVPFSFLIPEIANRNVEKTEVYPYYIHWE